MLVVGGLVEDQSGGKWVGDQLSVVGGFVIRPVIMEIMHKI